MSPTAVLILHTQGYVPLRQCYKSIVILIYRELLALGRKIDIFKLIYRYLLAFGR
jgi:hypothetical protein